MACLYQKSYPAISSDDDRLVVHDGQLELVKRFMEACPAEWQIVEKCKEHFLARSSFSLVCVTFFKRNPQGTAVRIDNKDFNFENLVIEVSDNTVPTCDDELDLVYNNIFVTFSQKK